MRNDYVLYGTCMLSDNVMTGTMKTLERLIWGTDLERHRLAHPRKREQSHAREQGGAEQREHGSSAASRVTSRASGKKQVKVCNPRPIFAMLSRVLVIGTGSS